MKTVGSSTSKLVRRAPFLGLRAELDFAGKGRRSRIKKKEGNLLRVSWHPGSPRDGFFTSQRLEKRSPDLGKVISCSSNAGRERHGRLSSQYPWFSSLWRFRGSRHQVSLSFSLKVRIRTVISLFFAPADRWQERRTFFGPKRRIDQISTSLVTDQGERTSSKLSRLNPPRFFPDRQAIFKEMAPKLSR